MKASENKSDFELTKETSYLTLSPSRASYGVCCEDFGKNWPRYNGITLYLNECVRPSDACLNVDGMALPGQVCALFHKG